MATRRKRLVVLLLLLNFLIISNISAQRQAKKNTSLGANILTYPSIPRIREDFQIIIRIAESSDVSRRVYYDKKTQPSQLQLLSGPFVQNVSDGITDYIYVTRSNAVGLFTLPTFYYEDSTGTYALNEASVEILPQNPNPENYQIQGAYRSPPLSIYQGQAFALVLEAKNLRELMPITVQNTPPIANAILETAPGIGEINEHRFQEELLYDVPVTAWIVAVNQAGRIILPTMNMKSASLESISAPSITIDILPLPDPAKKSGAVGDFRVTSDVSSTEIVDGRSLKVRFRIEGEGNFHIFNFPELQASTAFEISLESENKVLVPSSGGYFGHIERIYELKANDGMDLGMITIPEFTWWNPSELSIGSYESKSYPIKVTSSLIDGKLFSFFSPEFVMLKKDASPWKILGLWFLLIPLFFYRFFISRATPKENKLTFFWVLPLMLNTSFFAPTPIPSTLRSAYDFVAQENWQAAQEAFADTAKILPNNKAVLMYNQAVAMQKQEKFGWAGYYLMKAIQHDPFEPIYRQAWNLHQKELNLSSSRVQYGFYYSLGVYVFLFILAFFSIMLVVSIKFKPHIMKSLLIVVFSLPLLFLILFSYQLYGKKSWAIALEDVSLGRIPENNVSTLYVIREGTILEVIARFDNFYLLNNQQEGIEGWANTHYFAISSEGLR
ncbi:MAG: hypothetical protein ACRCVN_02515 [Spirochaetia bacterium]